MHACFACAVHCAAAETFVYRSGNQLYAEGGPFYFFGTDAVYLAATAAFGDKPSITIVKSVLDSAKVRWPT